MTTDAARAAYRAEKDALQRLLDLAEDERVAALATLRASDAALAAVVARRLALSDMPIVDPAQAPAPPRIARYAIHGELGKGGMGRVWRATRADAADRQQLAIKQIRADLADADAVRRFESERRILSRLDHPHIAPLLDAGTDADGRPFLVTALVEGEPIDVHCRTRALDVAARVRLVREIVSALAHAHRQLIVHRDLKPANVLVDGQGRVRLLDFGIAKLLDGGEEATAAGQSQMTLRYAAPEQVRGAPLGVGTDLYAVGVLLYELLAGCSPYPDTRDPAALIHAIAHEEPAPLPARDGRGERIPRDLAAIVARLLRKRPEQRYPSAEALLDELDRLARGEAVQALRHQRGYRAQRWLRRRWPWLAAAMVLLALGGLHAVRMERQLQATALERDKAQAVADHFVTMFQATTPNAARHGDITARELLAHARQRLLDDTATQQSPTSRAALLLALARVHHDLSLESEALELSETAVDLLRQGEDAFALADALRVAAGANYALNRNDAFIRQTRQALETLEAAGDTDNALYPRLLDNVGFTWFLEGDFARAWAYKDRGLAVSAAHLPESRPEYVRALVNAGGMASVAGDAARSHALLLTAQGEAEKLSPRNEDEEIFIARNLAVAERQLGRLQDSRERFAALMERASRYYGPGHREVVAILIGGAETAVAQERIDDALDGLAAAEANAHQSLPPEHGYFSDIEGLRGMALLERGDLDGACAHLDAARASRSGEHQIKSQLGLETVALARCGCHRRDAGPADATAALSALQAMGNASPWQLALAQRWAAQCDETVR